MNKYYVKYITRDDDDTEVWVNADSVNEARDQVLHEYWDVKEVIHIKKVA